MDNLPGVIIETSPRTPPVVLFVGFSGKKQVGKDTATQMAVEMLCIAGKRVAVTAFAGPLKRLCVEIIGLSHEGVYGTDAQKNELSHVLWDNMPNEIRSKYSTDGIWPRSGRMTNREVLQVVGSDIFRNLFGQDVWARAPFRQDWNDFDVVIFTDCRFPNEKSVTEEHGGSIIRLERHTGLSDNHISETALDKSTFEFRYQNDADIESLRHFVRNVLSTLKLL
jgi:hypothetical protein